MRLLSIAGARPQFVKLAVMCRALEFPQEREIRPVLLPAHPRTNKAMAATGIISQSITILRPVSYLEMLLLEGRARFMLTDSGGVQKETYFANVRCITRNETEWAETLEHDCNIPVGADEESIFASAANPRKAGPCSATYGDGQAGRTILDELHQRRRLPGSI